MPEVVSINTLSAALRRQFTAVKRPVLDLATRFSTVRASLDEIAPRVIGLYNSIKAENAQFSFAEFARLFDPSVPTHSADTDDEPGYRNHKVYYTLQYMQRKVTLGSRGRGAGVRTSASEALARTIATMLQLPGVDKDQIFETVKAEFGFGDRVMARLRRRVENTQPLFHLTVPRAGTVRVGNVIHMEPRPAAAAATEPAAAARGRGRRRAAA